MNKYKIVVVSLLILALQGCNTFKVKDSTSSSFSSSGPSIVGVLPEIIEGFRYVNHHEYPEPYGYSLRYVYEANTMVYSDIYIYPSPIDPAQYGHEEIVVGMTKTILKDFEELVRRGFYSEYNVISSGTFEVLDKLATRSELYLLKENMETYSLLFLTESNGKMVKVRISMPDNKANRMNRNWQEFVNRALTNILSNIENA